jgi:hypothetical protein
MDLLVDNTWRDSIQETDEFTHSFWKRLESAETENANNLGCKVKVRVGYNASESWAKPNGSAYATGSATEFKNLFVPYRFTSKACIYTKEAIDNDDAKAKYHPVLSELASARLEGMKSLNRHALMGNGLATIAVSSAVESGSTITCAPNTTFGNKGVQFLRPGKRIQIYDATGVTERVGGQTAGTIQVVSSFVKSTGVVTLTAAAPTDVVSTDIVVPEGSAALGMHGVEYWVANTGNLFELSRATYTGLQSVMVDGSTGSLLLLVEAMFAKSSFQNGANAGLGIKGSMQKEGFWSPTQRQGYRQDSLGLGMTQLGESLDAGYAHAETINGHKFTCEPDHSNNRINFLQMGDWGRIVRGNAERPFEIQKIHGQSITNVYDSSNRPTTTYQTILGGYVNVTCANVRNQSAIYGLPVSGLETGNS